MSGHQSRKSRVNELAKRFEYMANMDEQGAGGTLGLRSSTGSPQYKTNLTFTKTNSAISAHRPNPLVSTTIVTSPPYQQQYIQQQEIDSEASNSSSEFKEKQDSMNENMNQLTNMKRSDKRLIEEYAANEAVQNVFMQNTTQYQVEYVDKSEPVIYTDENIYTGPSEMLKLKNEVNMLKTENELLRLNLGEYQQNFRKFQAEYRLREKFVNEELKNLRKKVVYLLKKSVALNYTTDEEEGEERVISF